MIAGGLIVVLLASIVAMFVPAMLAGVSTVAALLFSGFIILFDPSRLIRGEEDNYEMAASSMYLNVLNMFLAVLQLLGFSVDD